MSPRRHHFVLAAVPAAVAVISLGTGLSAEAASQPGLRFAKSTTHSLLGEVRPQNGDDFCLDALSLGGNYVVRRGPAYCLPVRDSDDDERD